MKRNTEKEIIVYRNTDSTMAGICRLKGVLWTKYKLLWWFVFVEVDGETHGVIVEIQLKTSVSRRKKGERVKSSVLSWDLESGIRVMWTQVLFFRSACMYREFVQTRSLAVLSNSSWVCSREVRIMWFQWYKLMRR